MVRNLQVGPTCEASSGMPQGQVQTPAAWCRDRLVGAEELSSVGERPFRPVLPLDADRAVQAQPGPPPSYSATAAQGHELAGLRRQLTAAWEFDGLVHRRGDPSLAGRAPHHPRWATLVLRAGLMVWTPPTAHA